jgi:hypothetical protein
MNLDSIMSGSDAQQKIIFTRWKKTCCTTMTYAIKLKKTTPTKGIGSMIGLAQ